MFYSKPWYHWLSLLSFLNKMNQSTTPERQDPLRDTYREGFVTNPAHYEFLLQKDVALLCIDMQYLDAAEGYGVFKEPEDGSAHPIPAEAKRYYFDSLNKRVIPNMHVLQNCFRSHKLEVIHTRIQSLTQDGRDRGKGHKRLKLLARPGSAEACFLEEVAPMGDEIVINKTASGVFSSTNIHYVLKNIGIQSLYVCGVYTNECVETTVRDACDLGYLVTMVEDACTTVTQELQDASIKTLKDRYARTLKTQEVIDEIHQLVGDRFP
jgi:nicotinamidase-related amidase